MGYAMQLSDRIGRRLKLHDLHVLMAVVQAGSMNRAAALLNTTQPAVSKSIAELERTVGVRLLDRNPHGVEPTACGRTLLDGAATVFDELHQRVKSIEFLADPAAGDVRIGCNPFLAASFVSAVVDRLSQRFPRIVFHLVTGGNELLHRELSARNVDLLIARRSGPIADEPFNVEVLYDDSYVVVAGAQNPWARRRRIELAELVSEPWALPAPESVTGSITTEAFRAMGLDRPRVTVITISPEARISLLATGHFLSIFPASGLRFPTKRPEIKVLPIALPVARVPTGLVTLKNRTLSPVTQLFIEHARELAKPLVKGTS
jgi:DNA-binding transcriptional LysR family regulator